MESHEVSKAIDDRLVTAERSVAVNQHHDAVTGLGERERERERDKGYDVIKAMYDQLMPASQSVTGERER